MADLRLSYRRAGVDVFAFADNVFDASYVLIDFGASATMGQPREVGVGLALRF